MLDRRQSNQMQFENKKLVLWSGQLLSEDIRKLRSGSHVNKSNKTLLEFFPDQVTINVKMFGSLMKNKIVNYMNSYFVITLQKIRKLHINSQVF